MHHICWKTGDPDSRLLSIKVWDIRPFNASEWEEVDISGMEKTDWGAVVIEDVHFYYNYWKNTVTGDLRYEYSTLGEHSALEPIKVWDAGGLWASNRLSLA